jgi:AcrR family transcriptional regulator
MWQCYRPVLTVTSTRGPEAQNTTQRILDATYDEVLHFGVKGVSVESIARRVGIARITIYRRFASKEALLGALAARESERAFAKVDGIIEAHPNLDDQIVEGFAAVIAEFREHPIIKRTLVSERDVVMRFLEIQAGTMLGVAREYVAMRIRAQRPKLDARAIAEVILRVGLTFVLLPDSAIKMATTNDARAFARRFLVPMVQA